jgi:hypothetical protein
VQFVESKTFVLFLNNGASILIDASQNSLSCTVKYSTQQRFQKHMTSLKALADVIDNQHWKKLLTRALVEQDKFITDADILDPINKERERREA